MEIFYLAQKIDMDRPMSLISGDKVMRLSPAIGYPKAPGQLTAAEKEVAGIYLTGYLRPSLFDFREVGAEYYKARGEQPPYVDLVKCGTDLRSIVSFTLNWGPLGALSPVDEHISASPLPAHCRSLTQPLSGEFRMDLLGWVHLKQRFDALFTLASQSFKNRQTRDALALFFGEEEHNGLDGGSLEMAITWLDEGQTTIPRLQATTLYKAFVAMLWLDVGQRHRTMRRCVNPRCGDPFVSDRLNKRYCSDVCASKVAKRRYWKKTGSKARRKKIKEGRSK